MPTVFLIFFGLVGGWCFCLHFTSDRRLLHRKHLIKKRLAIRKAGIPRELFSQNRKFKRISLIRFLSELRSQELKSICSVFFILLFVIILLLLGLQAQGCQFAYTLEEYAISSRISVTMASFFVGIFLFLYKNEIFLVYQSARDLILEETTSGKKQTDPTEGGIASDRTSTADRPYKDQSLPWFIQGGVFVAIIVVAVLAFNPGFLKSITSLKAGSIEAHFAGNTAALQRGRVGLLDTSRKSTIYNWAAFDFDGENQERLFTYLRAGVPSWRISFTRALFQKGFLPLFEDLSCFERNDLKLTSAQKTELEGITFQLRTQIEADLRKKPSDPEGFILAFKLEDKLMEELDGPIKQKNLPDCQHITQVDGRKAADYLTDISREISLSCNHGAVVESRCEDRWDPYVIQVTSDLIELTSDRRSKEDFLVWAFGEMSKNKRMCAGVCRMPIAGQISLTYALVEAKVQSERPWPFQEMLDQLTGTLGDTVIWSRFYNAARAPIPQATQRALSDLYMRNRLIDLTLGLQFFYQRALVEKHFNRYQIRLWTDWLREVRSALQILTYVGGSPPLNIGADERVRWESAKEVVLKDPAIIQDAATATAMSAILLPEQTSVASASDCTVARSFLNFAKRQNLGSFFEQMKFEEDERQPYIGVMEQLEARIVEECGS